jgi:hypothetical protein
MTSWRDQASQQVQEDFDAVFAASLPFAEQQLSSYGEFFPYGVAVVTDGEIIFLSASDEVGDQPASGVVLQTLVDGVRHNLAEYRCVAFLADVRLESGDAIRLEVEHAERFAITIYLPYAMSIETQSIELGEITATDGRSQVWDS